ncbi:MAG TPA: hypothetical protein VLA19_32385, partial [Herpetosiphonaceae bacterium]|nr:hypothetical protein [Herpetosiphonaceae bacterium]
IAWCSRGWVLDLGLPALAELVLMAAALAASTGFLLSLAGPPLLPVGTSVDGGWHYARSDYVHSGGRLGVYQSRLGNVNAYPPGFHLLVALLAHWSGREPIFTLYPAAVLMFALLAGVAIQVAMDAVAGPRWRLLAGCGALLALMLAPTEATLEIIAREQFYPTAAGMTWLLAGVWGVGLLQRSGHPLALPVLGASAAGIVLFYPFWLAIALGLLAAMIVALRWRMWRRLLIELAVVLGATCAGLLLVHDLLGDQADFVRWDRLRSQAGILALAAAAALPALALYRRLHRWRLLPLVVAGVLATAQYGALNYLRNQPFAEYMAHKTHYLFPYLLAGLAAGVVGAAASKLRRVPALSVGAGGTALALLLGATGLYRQPSGWSGFSPYHPLTPDQVAAGIWMRDHLRPDPENVSFVVDDSITAYWLKTGILRGERGWSASSVQRYAPPHYAHWITDPATPTYALVAGAERADGPPMRVLFEHVTARVVERVPEARSAQRAVHVQVYSAIEQYAGRPTLRSAAYLSNLPDPAFELRFLLTEQHAGDEPPSVLWDQPLSTHRHAAGRYGLVRLDPAASTAWTWLDGAPRDVPPPVWTPGMALSGWMQLRYHDQPVATRRIYDFVAGDADSF